jgi:flagellar biosynthesis protein FlhG
VSSNITPVDFSQLRGRVEPGATIIAVGGGKGGVGKSFVSSSISIFLAQLGYRTLAIDLDLGCANLHTALGVPLSNRGINEFIVDPDLELTDLVQKTHWQNLELISGSSETLDIANIDETQRSRIMSAIFRYKSDFIILDLSAGTHHSTLDFFLMAKHKVAVFTPDPSSIENAYRFLKAGFFRKLRRYEHQLQLKNQIDDLLANKNSLKIKNPSDLIQALIEREPVLGPRLKDLLSELNFEIVLNQARTRDEMEMGHALQSVCNKYFGFPCELLGGLEYDNAVWQSLRQKNHLLIANRQSHLYAQLMSISRKIAKAKSLKAVV